MSIMQCVHSKFPGHISRGRFEFGRRGGGSLPLRSSASCQWTTELINEKGDDVSFDLIGDDTHTVCQTTKQFSDELEGTYLNPPVNAAYPLSTFVRPTPRRSRRPKQDDAQLQSSTVQFHEIEKSDRGDLKGHCGKALFIDSFQTSEELMGKTPALGRTTSVRGDDSTSSIGQQPLSHPSLQRSISAPETLFRVPSSPTIYKRCQFRSCQFQLPSGVKETPIVPSRCVSTTVVSYEGQAAVEVAWRSGGFLRVLPLVGVDIDLSLKLEHNFRIIVVKTLYSHARGEEMVSLNDVSLDELTDAVMESISTLEVSLATSSQMCGGRYGQDSSWNHSLRHTIGVVTGCNLEALSPFDVWCESEKEQEKENEECKQLNQQSRRNENGRCQHLGKYKVPTSQSVFGPQSCAVCGDQCSNPNNRSSSEMGGAALSACGHWCCMKCWENYLESASTRKTADVRCPVYQCKVTHSLDRGILAHLVGPGIQGAHAFSNLERLRIEKAQFLRRVQSEEAQIEEGFEQFDAHDHNNQKVVSRYCPDPHCNKLLRGSVKGSNDGVAYQPPMVLLCKCGAAVCAACGVEDGHLGLSCEQKALHSKQAEELEVEKARLYLIESNSRPCPKCAHSVFKRNEEFRMTCPSCNHRFCWECMGPGFVCNVYFLDSFKCRSSSTVKKAVRKQYFGTSSSIFDTSILAAGHFEVKHALSERRGVLEGVINKTSQSEPEPSKALSTQLLLIKYWLHLLISVNKAPHLTPPEIRVAIQKQKSKYCPSNTSDPKLVECIGEVDVALKVLHVQRLAASQNAPTKRAQQSVHQKIQRDNNKGYDNGDELNIFTGVLNQQKADAQMRVCLQMSRNELSQYISSIIRKCVRLLSKASAHAHSTEQLTSYVVSISSSITANKSKKEGKKTSKRGSSRPAEDLLQRSNFLSGRHLPGGYGRKFNGVYGVFKGVPSWQNKDRDDEDPSLASTSGKKEIKIRWKGREKAKGHTQRAMKAFEWEVGI